MKSIRLMLAGASLLLFCSCGAQVQKETQVANANESKENAVIETIMSRRSIRQYKPQAVNRDTMQIILDCGINAPNGQNKQSWEVRVVDNPDFINGITEIYKKENPKAAEDPKFKNISKRTGRWFLSSVTKKVITSFSFPFLSYSTNEKIRQR